MTVAVTLNAPAAVYTCEAVGPAETVPSPQSTVDALMLPPEFGSLDAAVDAEIVAGVTPEVADRLSAATGASAFAVTAAVLVLLVPLLLTTVAFTV